MESKQKIIRYGRTGAGAQHSFTLSLRAALENKGMTLASACDMAGLGVSAPSRWTRGRNGPFRESLDKLVNILEAPELLDKISWRWRRWTLTCTKCGRSEQHEPGQFRSGRKRGFHQEAVVDEVAGTGTYACIRCKQSEVGRRTRPYAQLRKRKGKEALKEKVPKLTPEQRLEYRERAWAANRGRPRGPEERWNHTLGNIRPRPVGRWGICRRCDYAAFSKKPYRPVEMHHGCQDQHRRERQGEFGRPPAAPRYARRGPQPTSEELADSFDMAVRFLLPPTRRRKKATLEQLAHEFHLARDSVRDRIKTFIDRLPSDDRGGRQLAVYARALREAWERHTADG